MIASVVSGGFDPLHAGHVRMIREAAKYGEELIVVVNTDEWLLRKKGYVSISLAERMEIVAAIEGVSSVIPAEDDDETVCKTLLALSTKYEKIVFCNGGDRGRDNTPEMEVLASVGGQSVFGVGGEQKTNSSSLIWPKHSLGRVQRLWGSYFDHFRNENCVFKTLEIEPAKGTSYQRHAHRDEFWFMERGYGIVTIGQQRLLMDTGGWLHVPRETWHSIVAGPDGATVREMQIGVCSEDDIERK